MARSALINLREAQNKGRFENVLTQAKTRFDTDKRYRYDQSISPNYHVESVLGEIQHRGEPYEVIGYGRLDKYSPGIATEVEANRHVLVPYKRGALVQNLPRELVKAVASAGRFRLLQVCRNGEKIRVSEQKMAGGVAAFLRKARQGHRLELIFGDYAESGGSGRHPKGQLVVTIVPKPDHQRVGKNEGYVHVRVLQSVSVSHLGKPGWPIPAFNIKEYPTGAEDSIGKTLDYFNSVINAIGTRVKGGNPFQAHTHLRRDAHYYFNRNESIM